MQNNQYPFADLPGGVIFMAWVFAWPLGLALTILKSISTSQRDAARGQNRAGTSYSTGTRQNSKGVNVTIDPARKNAGNFKWDVFFIILGCVFAFIGAMSFFDELYYLIRFGVSYLPDVLTGLGMFAGGLASVFAGSKIRKTERLHKRYKAVVGDRDYMAISEIAAAIPSSFNTAKNVLQDAIDKNVFGPSAYIDMRTKTLVVRGTGPAAEPVAPKAKKTTPKAVKTEESRYQQILRELREVNIAIPGEEMTAKIDRLEDLTAKIFKLVEEDPAKLPQLRSFMDYYLPTALKLLNAYSQFDQQGIDGDNITVAKTKIENSMDALVQGFERQLDQLFQNDVMDVTSDIQVLENMMNQDGLLNDGNFQVK